MMVKYGEFKTALERGEVFPAYLFEGEEKYFGEKGLELLEKKYLSEPSLNLAEFGQGEAVAGEIVASLDAYPFMSEKRFTVVKEFYPTAADGKILKRYFEAPSKSSVLVVINEKSCDFLKKTDGICCVDCSKADTGTLARWIKSRCAEDKIDIDLERAALLAEYCSSDMSRIINETAKLCAYVKDKGAISSNDIELLVSRDSDYKIYEMTDYIAKKKYDLALYIIDDMLSRGETPQRIMASVYNYFRRLLFAAISDMSDGELASAFGVKEYAAMKTRKQSLLFKKRALKAAVDRLCEADYEFKSGKTSADDEMWLAIFSIMND